MTFFLFTQYHYSGYMRWMCRVLAMKVKRRIPMKRMLHHSIRVFSTTFSHFLRLSYKFYSVMPMHLMSRGHCQIDPFCILVTCSELVNNALLVFFFFFWKFGRCWWIEFNNNNNNCIRIKKKKKWNALIKYIAFCMDQYAVMAILFSF